ncbi:hypothetical protein CUMW_113940 [Citrus unshiu]|nr:hypothetical protein CUMW_113940 [Citrus unshiu]
MKKKESKASVEPTSNKSWSTVQKAFRPLDDLKFGSYQIILILNLISTSAESTLASKNKTDDILYEKVRIIVLTVLAAITEKPRGSTFSELWLLMQLLIIWSKKLPALVGSYPGISLIRIEEGHSENRTRAEDLARSKQMSLPHDYLVTVHILGRFAPGIPSLLMSSMQKPVNDIELYLMKIPLIQDKSFGNILKCNIWRIEEGHSENRTWERIWQDASGQHLLKPLERCQLLQMHLSMKSLNEQISNMINLFFQAEIFSFLLGVPHHIDDRSIALIFKLKFLFIKQRMP